MPDTPLTHSDFVANFQIDQRPVRGRAVRILYIINGMMLHQLATPMENFEKDVLLPALLEAANP